MTKRYICLYDIKQDRGGGNSVGHFQKNRLIDTILWSSSESWNPTIFLKSDINFYWIGWDSLVGNVMFTYKCNISNAI